MTQHILTCILAFILGASIMCVWIFIFNILKDTVYKNSENCDEFAWTILFLISPIIFTVWIFVMPVLIIAGIVYQIFKNSPIKSIQTIFIFFVETIAKSFGKFLENVWHDIMKTLYEKEGENVRKE